MLWIIKISVHGLKYMLEVYKIKGLIPDQLFGFHSLNKRWVEDQAV